MGLPIFDFEWMKYLSCHSRGGGGEGAGAGEREGEREREREREGACWMQDVMNVPVHPSRSRELINK